MELLLYKITFIINLCNKLCEIPFYINNIIVDNLRGSRSR